MLCTLKIRYNSSGLRRLRNGILQPLLDFLLKINRVHYDVIITKNMTRNLYKHAHVQTRDLHH
jgi:hypothetical protein